MLLRKNFQEVKNEERWHTRYSRYRDSERVYSAIVSLAVSVGLVVFLSCLAIVMSIIAVVFGIQSIKIFIVDKNADKPKPIATLVCGIVGVASSVISVLLGLIGIISILFAYELFVL